MTQQITVQAKVEAPIEKAWEAYTKPEHITKWNHASDDWHCPRAENDLRVGGNFSSRMESKDGTIGFDFGGTYTEVIPMQKIAYTFGGRNATVLFTPEGEGTVVTVSFDPEHENPIDMQFEGWQAILNNYKKHAESL